MGGSILMEIFVYWGSSGMYLENILLVMKVVILFGVDGIELDIYVLKSGELIVMYDECVDRIINGFGFLKDYIFLEVKKLVIGKWFFCKICVLILEEIFKLVSGIDMILNIELKMDVFEYEGIE